MLSILSLCLCLDVKPLPSVVGSRSFPRARVLQSLLTGYVRRFNKIHRRQRHLFEGRYKAIVCERDSYLLELVRYIHLNPVRAAIVKRPRNWQWSGHKEYLGKEKRGLMKLHSETSEGELPSRMAPRRWGAVFRSGALREED